MNMLAWQRQKKTISLDAFENESCFVAVDLSSKKDLTSVCILFRKDGHYYAFQKFYAPEAALEENDKYRQFDIAGELTLTPGSTTDYAFVEEELRDLAKRFKVERFIFDQWQANYLITRMQEQRLPVMELPMTVKNLSDSMKEVEARILERELWHDGNTCMTWQMGNVTAKMDARNNIYPRKENENDPRCHIDGPVTLIMAMSRWQLEHENCGLSDFLSNPVSI
jgi:phage terminase large subunit-like protein